MKAVRRAINAKAAKSTDWLRRSDVTPESSIEICLVDLTRPSHFPSSISLPMAQRAIILPIRALSRPHSRPAQWICSRCLATQSATINSSSPPPSSSKANTREALSKRLAHDIPIQYLQHSTSNALHPEEQAQREKAEAHRRIVGVVVSSGRMRKTVKVRIPGKEWNKKIGKVSYPLEPFDVTQISEPFYSTSPAQQTT